MKYIRIGVISEAIVLIFLSIADAIVSCLYAVQGTKFSAAKKSLEYTIDYLLLVVHAVSIAVYITAYIVLSTALRQQFLLRQSEMGP